MAAYRCSTDDLLQGELSKSNQFMKLLVSHWLFASFRHPLPVGPLQITKATMWIFSSWTPIIVQGPSSGCIHRGKMDVIYGWKCCIQLTSASSSETEVSLNWMAVYGIDRRPWHCLVFSSIYTITISSPK
jgi:hypothetical protein